MPFYTFISKSGEKKDIFFKIKDKKEYLEDGEKWERVFLPPQISTDTSWNEFSSIDFVEKSKKKKGSYGELLDKAKELGEKREQRAGKDFHKENYYKKWSKTRRGKDHPDIKQKKLKDSLSKLGIIA
ncbi:MAG: hypothetical protein AABY22_14775 [Nanoarchaeota archaeon]